MATDALKSLTDLIHARRTAPSDKSYTRQLLDAGPEKCAKKLGEEAVETVIAGVSGTPDQVIGEAADLVYHLLVLLEARGVTFDDVLVVLEGRMRQSGLDEKASRKG